MKMTTAELRQKFIAYFQSHGHEAVASSSLVPVNDPTLLFTNAGMNQFKDIFLGKEVRDYSKAVTSQRCVRAGGKHNDLENVGYTARHHTFFEMLGNFSFGDYFKKDAIRFAWRFLTNELQLPEEKLLVTVYSEDEEAFEIWRDDMGLPEEKIIRISTSDNFWSMGDTGPCGPCSEIFYDHGDHIWGGPPGSPEEDGDRYIEIWNLVFMQFNRQADGEMLALPKPSIDTGMGLERISAILQGVHSNYEIDLFDNLIRAAANIVGTNDLEAKSLRVIADHIRSCAFLICDGVMPSNEGRGYVLRRIIRRAVRHGYKLGANDIFFYKLVSQLSAEMSQAYPELSEQKAVVEKVLRVEEEQFSKTLERGMLILNDTLSSLKGTTLPGDVVFKLYDTYGFPVDLTNDVAREHDIDLDMEGFESAMQEQRERAKKASHFDVIDGQEISTELSTEFAGYDHSSGSAVVKDILVDGASVDRLEDGQEGWVILDTTPFYAESGGQVGDKGTICTDTMTFDVMDTQKLADAFVHKGVSTGVVRRGDSVKASIDVTIRQAIRLNHSATHLLHAALRQVLGEHVTQKGSLVDADKLRFDFSHFSAVTSEELIQIENLVNQNIRYNHLLTTQLMNLQEAKESGAMALFGEKYDDDVRVISMGEFSTELCGGTHVERTGDIGSFTIISETGIASGIRRIEAVTGETANVFNQKQVDSLTAIARLLKTDASSVQDKLQMLQNDYKDLEKELSALKAKMASRQGADLLSEAVQINNVNVLIKQIDGVEVKSLRTMMDELKNRIGSGILVLAVAQPDKVNLIVGVTKDLTEKVRAGELVNHIAAQVGGKGGGRPDMAQAGGDQPEKLPSALNSVNTWLNDRL